MKRKPKVTLLSIEGDSSSSSETSSSKSESSNNSKSSSQLTPKKSKTDLVRAFSRVACAHEMLTSTVDLQILSKLFEPSLLKKYRRSFDERDGGHKGKLSKSKIIAMVEEHCDSKKKGAEKFDVSSTLATWFDSSDELRTHRKFEFKTMMLAFAYAKHRESKLRIEQSIASALDGRFASFHESKRQLELWQQKLGFRTFNTLQRYFHESALPNMIPSRIQVSEVRHIFDQVTQSAAPNKPLEVYLQQMRLQSHNTLLLPEFLCCYYQLYGSSDSRPASSESLELRPIAFVASCLFSNGNTICNRHGDLMRRLSVGRTPAQQDLILRFREVFEALQSNESDPEDSTIQTSQLSAFAVKVVHDPTMLEPALASLRKRAATVSLIEIYAACGFVIDELTAAPTISNAIEKLRLRVEVAEVRRIIGVVRNVCLKILRFPNNSDYWRIRADSAAFQQKLGRFDGATHLLEAVGFVEHNKTHFELRGARTADGKRTSALSKITLDKLREHCVELDAELSLFDGVESVSSILQRIATDREREAPLTLDECNDILKNLSAYIENVLKNPKDARCWRIREANKAYQKQIGYLPFSADLMESIGYELVQTSQGNVFALRGTGSLSSSESSKRHASAKNSEEASLSNFTFSRVSEQMEWFLWRKKQEIDTLFEDEMQYLVDIVRTRSTCLSEKKLSCHPETQITNRDSVITKMYPYGKNAVDTFNKTAVQRMQIDMMKKVFASMDLEERGFLIEQDFDRLDNDPHTPSWMRFEALDIDNDKKVDFADFVAALGPMLDHSFDTKATHQQVSPLKTESLTLCELVSLAVGRVRVGASLHEASSGLKCLLLLLHKIIQEPTKQELWCVREKNEIWLKLLRFQAGRELLRLCGFRDLAGAESHCADDSQSSDVKFALQPQKTRFKTSKSAAEPPQTLDAGTITRLQTIAAIVCGHCRGMKFPEISDVSAVARAIGFMNDCFGWMRLVELAILCVMNVLKHPDDNRYRQLKTSTQTYSKVVESVRGGAELMLSLGFRETDVGTLLLSPEVNSAMLIARKLELEAGLMLLRAANSIRHDSSIAVRGASFRTTVDCQSEERDVEFYKKKALSAELARQEEIKKSQRLEKQLELLSEARGGRKLQPVRGTSSTIETPQGRRNPRSAPERSGRQASKVTHSSTYDSDLIEAEILSELSPLRGSTRTKVTTQGKPDPKNQPAGASSARGSASTRNTKSLQRRSPSVPSTPV